MCFSAVLCLVNKGLKAFVENNNTAEGSYTLHTKLQGFFSGKIIDKFVAHTCIYKAVEENRCSSDKKCSVYER